MIEDCFGDEADGDHHVLTPCEIGVEIKVFDVHGHEKGFGGG